MRTRCAEIGITRLTIHRKNYSSHFPLAQLPVLLLNGPALKQQVIKAMKGLPSSFEESKRRQEIFMVLYHASLYEECLSEQTPHTVRTIYQIQVPGFQPVCATDLNQSHLILLSIRCLNHSLDAIRSQPLPEALHHACKPQRCGLHSIAKLQQSSSIYINILNDVMFSKWGLSKHRYWWLAIFYSLCIQSFVRVNLIKLSESVRSSSRNLDQCSDARL